MLNALIGFSLRNRFVVLLFAALLIYAGSTRRSNCRSTPFPTPRPIQVQINTVAPALAPEEIEKQVTYPVELSLGGMKGLFRGPARCPKFGAFAGGGDLRGRRSTSISPVSR